MPVENPWRPTSLPKKGHNATIDKFPDYIEVSSECGAVIRDTGLHAAPPSSLAQHTRRGVRASACVRVPVGVGRCV